MKPKENWNVAKDQPKKQAKQPDRGEGQKQQKSREEYARIGILVAIVLVAAAAAAVYMDSPKSCSGIVFSTQRDSCFSAEAAATGNSTICYSISSNPLQESCLEGVAYATKNASICASIKDGAMAYSCTANVSISTGNEAACAGLKNSSSRSECRYSFAQAENFSNASYCSGISNSTLYSYCAGSSSYSIAIKTGNASYCSEMNSTPGGGVPTADLLESLPQGLSSRLSSSSILLLNASNADLCYYSVAVDHSNRSVCGLMSGPVSTACSYYVNSTTVPKQALNISVLMSKCDEAGAYGGFATTDACLIGFAVLYENATYCSLITNSSSESACMSDVASRKANSSS